jgi:antiphage defense system Thoeris ThsA-like protein
MDVLKTLLRQKLPVISFIVGAVFLALPFVTADKDYHLTTHPPNTMLLFWIGLGLLVLAVALHLLSIFLTGRPARADDAAGVDLSRVKESDGAMWTNVNGCEIHVVSGRIEEYLNDPRTAVVLPCNEYFDDRCAGDTRSALGAYVNRVFDGQAAEFVSLVRQECVRKLGRGEEQQKTDDERSESFGVGRCVLLTSPLGRSVPVALVSTTTQRAGQGLSARISYLFLGMRELFGRLADCRLNQVAMPILGAGHGQIDPPLAFVGLLLAIAEAARYGQGGQRPRKVTIVVFKPDANSPAQVDKTVVRRALALIGSRT